MVILLANIVLFVGLLSEQDEGQNLRILTLEMAAVCRRKRKEDSIGRMFLTGDLLFLNNECIIIVNQA